jgi:hypothetical protein
MRYLQRYRRAYNKTLEDNILINIYQPIPLTQPDSSSVLIVAFKKYSQATYQRRGHGIENAESLTCRRSSGGATKLSKQPGSGRRTACLAPTETTAAALLSFAAGSFIWTVGGDNGPDNWL